MCNARLEQLILACELTHEIKDKCVVVYVVFGYAHAMIHGCINKCEFASVLNHHIIAMGDTCSLAQDGVPLY